MANMKPSVKILIYIVLTIFLVLWIYPIIVAVGKSLNINGLGNYAAVLQHPKVNYFKVVFNSLLISVATAFIVMIITTLGGYAFSKMQFKGKNVIYILLLSCLAVPVAAVTMPLFFTVKNLGVMGTYAGVILPLVAFNAPMMLLVVRNYFDGIPNEIIEAATIDGCSKFQIYRGILMPLSVPILANVGVLTFVYSWNDYLVPLLFVRDESHYTVTLAATYFMETRSQTPEMMAQLYAALIMMTIPSVIVYLFSQKYLQSGITAGAVKS